MVWYDPNAGKDTPDWFAILLIILASIFLYAMTSTWSIG